MADKFTAILMSPGHEDASAHACRKTQSPMGTMSPVSSAIGMNSEGRTKPRDGCLQRISASQPMTRLSITLISG